MVREKEPNRDRKYGSTHSRVQQGFLRRRKERTNTIRTIFGASLTTIVQKILDKSTENKY